MTDQDQHTTIKNLANALVIRQQQHVSNTCDKPPLLSKRDDLSTDLKSLPSVTNYDTVPVDKFGLSMLLDMGWKEGDSIGRNKKNGLSKPIQYIPRPLRLGLGAKPAPTTDINSKRSKPVYELPTDINGKVKHYIGVDEQFKEQPVLKVRSLVKIVNGPHADMLGCVTQLFNHKEQTVVELNATGDRVKVDAKDLVLLRTDQFDREIIKRSISDTPAPNPHAKPARTWIQSGLYVRIVSKSLDGGRYYLRKASILDVLPGGCADIQVDDSRHTVLHNVMQSDLETIVPNVGSQVCIVSLSPTNFTDKPYLLNAFGQITHKDKAKQEVVVLTTDDEVVICHFDHVCALAPR